ncbi:MAG: DUF4974 domain-containing protein [Candidatus Pedobacter colombiensis]|uniref:DUF4974 domain-containing protein n=1 Tax=Candidatus Pedobacter colombiensis TaxID=3121371 RepID=A0AAJ5W9Z1_9SPHI|nr:FecR domain-containing protein [Pedobacter sp.]WEK20008.1 MAG: DUF4974 domain-containing protein [Pedobacter sp.]
MQFPNENFLVEDLVCSESFQQYCLGASLAEQLSWNEWIAQHPGRLEDIEYAKKIVCLLSLNQGSRIEQLKQLRSGIKQHEVFQRNLSFDNASGNDLSVVKPKRTKLYKYIGGVAAAVAILISFYFIRNQSSIPRLPIDTEQQAMLVVNSGGAARKTVVLEDGTIITLARESSIKVLKRFNTDKRELWLNGEAFFDVKHDASRPFTVHTPFDEVRVLGTTFNVKAYPGSPAMETSLIKGSVQVNSKQYAGYSVILKPNQKLISTKVTDLVADNNPKSHFVVSSLKNRRPDQPPVELKWVKTRLDIDNQPLSVIVSKLQNWYGIEILITDDKVKDYRYSGIFENETLMKTLEALQLSYPFTFKMEQDKIIISK